MSDAEQHGDSAGRRKRDRDQHPHDGLGIAAGIVGGGLVCLWAPGYLEATTGWRTAWLLFGMLLGLVGVASAINELGKLQGRELALSDLAVASFLAGLAGVLFALERRETLSGVWGTSAKVAVVFLVFWVPTGLFRGLVRLYDRPQGTATSGSHQRGGAVAQVLTTLTAAAGLITALVNLVQASRQP